MNTPGNSPTGDRMERAESTYPGSGSRRAQTPPQIELYLSRPAPLRHKPPERFLAFENTFCGSDLGDLFLVEEGWFFCKYHALSPHSPLLNQLVGGFVFAAWKGIERNKEIRDLVEIARKQRDLDFGYSPQCRCAKRTGSFSLPAATVRRVELSDSTLIAEAGDGQTHRFQLTDTERMEEFRRNPSPSAHDGKLEQAEAYGLLCPHQPPEVLVFLLENGDFAGPGAGARLDDAAADSGYMERVWTAFKDLPQSRQRNVLDHLPSCGSAGFLSTFTAYTRKAAATSIGSGGFFGCLGTWVLITLAAFTLLGRSSDPAVQLLGGLAILVFVLGSGGLLVVLLGRDYLWGRYLRRYLDSLGVR